MWYLPSLARRALSDISLTYFTSAKLLTIAVVSCGFALWICSSLSAYSGLIDSLAWCSKVGNRRNFSCFTSKPFLYSKMPPLRKSIVCLPSSRAAQTIAHSFSACIALSQTFYDFLDSLINADNHWSVGNYKPAYLRFAQAHQKLLECHQVFCFKSQHKVLVV